MMSLPPEWWKPMRPHREQTRLMLSRKRHKVVVAGRGSGKTELARRYICMKMLESYPYPDPKFAYVLPTLDMGRKIAWNNITKMLPEDLYATVRGKPLKNEGRMSFKLKNGAEFYVLSAEKPQRAEGVQWNGIIFDESSDLRPNIFNVNFGPAMNHRRAWTWRIGVPKRRGVGALEFKKAFDAALYDPNIDAFTWKSATVLSEEELQDWRTRLTPEDYREQYEASWESATGQIYPNFNDANISESCVYRPNLPLIVGCDFNVDPMAWVLCHFVEGLDGVKRLKVFDEVFLRGTNTHHALTYLYSKYPLHDAGWIFIGDASSKARKTSASHSDYLQILNDERFKNKRLAFPEANPALADRFSCVNVAICDANGLRKVQIHPSCKNIITDLEMMAYKEFTSEPDNTNKMLGHISDALGYAIWQLLPLKLESFPQSAVMYNA